MEFEGVNSKLKCQWKEKNYMGGECERNGGKPQARQPGPHHGQSRTEFGRRQNANEQEKYRRLGLNGFY